MAMKQTQTKMFDFSDVGLDLCSGSKNLFPDRFKKMLSAGYNEQTVASVVISGNQITLNYGVSHGYVADRVLKINSGALSAINDGEFWIDSVTTNTVTFTLDNAPSITPSGFTTKIAPLGWNLVHESTNGFIQVYEFKHIDNTVRYARLVFQSLLDHRNSVTACIGKTFDVTTGFITDTLSYEATRSNLNPNLNAYAWMFTFDANTTWNNASSSQGQVFGKCIVVGSLYHFLTCTNYGIYDGYNLSLNCINGIVPTACADYEALDYPAILAYLANGTSTTPSVYHSYQTGRFLVGSISSKLDCNTNYIAISPVSKSSVLPTSLDPFLVTTSKPLQLFEETSDQFLGVVPFGLYLGCYASNSKPGFYNSQTPKLGYDSNTGNILITHCLGAYNTTETPVFFHVPVEGIDHAN